MHTINRKMNIKQHVLYLRIHVRADLLLEKIPAVFVTLQMYFPESAFANVCIVSDGLSSVPPEYFPEADETLITFSFTSNSPMAFLAATNPSWIGQRIQ